MQSQNLLLLCLFGLTFVLLACAATEGNSADANDVDVDDEKLDYAKGSLCGYCDYCKFCKLCDEDCPCESSATKPNCNMCKYCKYCYLCKVCDTVCQPGGFLDRVTASIVNALPSYDKEEVEKDLEGVQSWMEKNKDEL